MLLDIRQLKRLHIFILVSFLLSLSACSQSQHYTPEKPLPILITATPSKSFTDKSHPTITITSTALPAKMTIENTMIMTQTPSPKPETELGVKEIGTNGNEEIETAFWCDDGKQIYFATISSAEIDMLDWFAYDVRTQTVLTITSPINYDESLWQLLNVSEPIPNSEIQGLISPSGQQVIYTITYGSPPLNLDNNPDARVEFWLADTQSLQKTKLFEQNWGSVSSATWTPDESNVFFTVAYEGPASLVTASIHDGTFDWMPVSIEGEWALSPDGSNLAVYGVHRANAWTDSHLFITSAPTWMTETVKLDSSQNMPIGWSQNSEVLYYWAKSSGNKSLRLCSYNIKNGNQVCLIALSDLEKSFGYANYMDFAVSPNGKNIVFWGPALWLVTLP
jgi:hypothetical protein